MTFRGRLLSAATLVTLVTLGIALVAIYLSVNDSQEDQLDAALLREAYEEARETASKGGDELVISSRPGPMANDVGPLTKFAVIYGAESQVIAATPAFGNDVPPAGFWRHPLGEPFNAWIGKEHLRAVRVPVPGHEGVVLVLAAPRADLDGDARFLARANLLILGIAVIWTVGVGGWLLRRLTRDHDRIIAVARRVSAGDLTARVGAGSHDREIAQLGRDIDEMIERIGLLVVSQQRFIAHAAHELRSPLTTLYGELSLALRKQRTADEYRAAMEEALASTRQLRDLTEDLLTLARLGAGPLQPGVRVPLRSVVDAAVASVGGLLAERPVRVVVQGDDVAVEGQARDLERLLRNLIENAIQHASSEVMVTLTALPDPRVLVTDDGPGIQAEDLPRIFEPFYRGARDRAERNAGTGLGLAIASEIARLHGATLGASTTARGAAFVVQFQASAASSGSSMNTSPASTTTG